MTAGRNTQGRPDAEPGAAAVAFPPFLCSTSGLLQGLLNRAGDNLSEADLTHISGLTEDAECMVKQIASLCEGLGCLISADDDNGERAGTGSFQTGDDLSRLLWFIGSMADQAYGLFEAASAAKDLRKARSVRGRA